MYNPSYFKITDQTDALRIMQQYPFATVITSAGEISHLPLVAVKNGEKLLLRGHLARANSQWKSFVSGVVTTIFHGPHTFITPVWYTGPNVPTWNYVVVHAKGRARLLETYDEIVLCLQELNTLTETNWPSGWKFEVPEDLAGEKLTRAIVGFEIEVTEIDFKKKLSQNRSASDRNGVLNGLTSRPDEQSKLVLNEMLKAYGLEK